MNKRYDSLAKRLIFAFVISCLCVTGLHALTPKVTLNSPSYNSYHNSGANVSLSGNLSFVDDDGTSASGLVGRLDVYVDDEEYAKGVSVPQQGGNWNLTVSSLSDGVHTLQFLVIFADPSQTPLVAEALYLENDYHLFLGRKDIKVNFQPSSKPVYYDYLKDSGAAYQAQGGLNYGWSGSAVTTVSRSDNNVWPDQFYTLIEWPNDGDARWEMEVPNGRYLVEVTFGDRNDLVSSSEPWKFRVENVVVDVPIESGDYTYKGGDPGFGVNYVKAEVNVEDGRVSLANLSPVSNGPVKLNHIRIRHLGPVAEETRLYRGSGYDVRFHSTVWPNSNTVKGIMPADHRYDDPETVIDESELWFNQLFWESSRQTIQVSPLTNKDYYAPNSNYHSDIVSGGQYSATGILANDLPIAVFGTPELNAPLYVNERFQLGLHFGEIIKSGSAVESSWKKGIQILAYLKSDVAQNPQTAVPQTLEIELPDPDDAADLVGWTQAASEGFTRTYELQGLTTTIEYAPEGWGLAKDSLPFVISHEADNSDYYYVVKGGAVNPLLRDGSNGALPMAYPADQYSPLYALSFSQPLNWRVNYIPKPNFASEPMPPVAEGDEFELLLNGTDSLIEFNLSGSTSNYLFADNDETGSRSPELRRHSELSDFVSNVLDNDPIAIAAYVHNEIELTDAFGYGSAGSNLSKHALNSAGLSRSAYGVFQEHQGAPLEQCALLIYMLREAGIPAAYVFPEDNTTKLLKSSASRMLGYQWEGALDLSGSTYEYGESVDLGVGTDSELVPVNYPWVAAYVEIDGVSKWIHLFPWMKDYEIVEGHDVFNFMPDRYRNAYSWVDQYYRYDNVASTDDGEFLSIFESVGINGDDAPSTLFPKFFQQILNRDHAGLSIEDFGTMRKLRQNAYTSWYEFPEPHTVQTTNFDEYASVDAINPPDSPLGQVIDDIFNKVNVQFYDVNDLETPALETGDMRICDIQNRRLFAWWSPESRVQTDVDGLLFFEAEAYDNIVAQGGHEWTLLESPDGSSGSGALEATPAAGDDDVDVIGNVTSSSPRLDYDLEFTKTGTHYIWIRGYSKSGNDNSCWIGLDGVPQTYIKATYDESDNVAGVPQYYWHRFTADSYVHSGGTLSGSNYCDLVEGANWPTKASINIPSTGNHTFNIWMKDDGFIIDRVLITTNSDTTVTEGGTPCSSSWFSRLEDFWEAQPSGIKANLHLTLASVRPEAVDFDSPDSGVFADSFSGTTNNKLIDEQEIRLEVARLGPFNQDPDYPAFVSVINKSDYSKALGSFSDVLNVAPGLLLDNSDSAQSTFAYGEMGALSLGLGQVSDDMILQSVREHEAALAQGGIANWNAHRYYERIGNLLHLLGSNYNQRLFTGSEYIEDLFKVRYMSKLTLGWAKLSPDFRKTTGDSEILPLNVPNLDIVYSNNSFIGTANTHLDEAGYSNRSKMFFPMFTAESSAQEHLALQTFFDNSPAISTTKLFHLSEKAGNPIIELNALNYESEGLVSYANVAEDPGTSGDETEQLKDFDDGVWADIVKTFENNQISKTYITPGAVASLPDDVENSAYVGVGAALHEPFSSAARIGSNNGSYVSFSTVDFSAGSLGNIRLVTNSPSRGSSQFSNLLFRPTGGFSFNPSSSNGGQVFEFPTSTVSLDFDATTVQSAPVAFDRTIVNDDLPQLVDEIQAGNADFNPVEWSNLLGEASDLSAGQRDLSGSTPSAGGYNGSDVSEAIQLAEDRGSVGDNLDAPYSPSSMGVVDSSSGNSNRIAGDPVDVLTGAFLMDSIDLSVVSPIPLAIRRNYSSTSSVKSSLGYGWKLSVTPYLVVAGEGDFNAGSNPDAYKGIRIKKASLNGSVLCYKNEKDGGGNPTNIWRPLVEDNPQIENYNDGRIGGTNNPFHCYLEKEIDGSDTIYWAHMPDGSKTKYVVRSYPVLFDLGPDGIADTGDDVFVQRERPYFDYHEDALGNRITAIFYEDTDDLGYGYLKRLSSSNGNWLELFYNNANQMTKVRTNDGRSVEYDYNSFGDLTKVVRADRSVVNYDYATGYIVYGDETEYRSSFERTTFRNSSYGSRVRGWITPPATGMYRFSISSSNQSALFLSENESPEAYTGFGESIANVQTAASQGDFSGTGQVSAWISLEAGKQYYIEAIHRNEDSSDHLQVHWEQQGGFARQVIDGQYLIPWSPVGGFNGDTGSILWEYFDDFSDADLFALLPHMAEKAILYSTHLLTQVKRPDGRLLVNSYDPSYDPNRNFASDNSSRRVYQQFNTVGDDLDPILIATYEYDDAPTGWPTGYKSTKIFSEAQPTHGRPVTTYIFKDYLMRHIADAKAVGFGPSNTDIDHVITYDWFEPSESATSGYYPRSLQSIRDKRGLISGFSYDASGNLAERSMTGDLIGDGVATTEISYKYFYNAKHLLIKEINQAPGQSSNDYSKVTFIDYPDTDDGGTPEEELKRDDPQNAGFVEFAYLPKQIKHYAIINPAESANEPSSGLINTITLLYGDEDNGEAVGSAARVEANGLLKRRTMQSSLDVDDKTEVNWTHFADGLIQDETIHTFVGNPAETLTSTFAYNVRDELTTVTDPAGRVTRLDYDSMGRLTSNLRYQNASASTPLSWDYRHYTENGELAWSDGPRRNPEDYIFYDYDGAGRLSAVINWRTQAKADGTGIEAVPGQDVFLGQSVSLFSYDAFGNLESQHDPLGNLTEYEYDELGRLTSVEYAGVANDTESFLYEPGGLVTSHTNTKSGVTTSQYTSTGLVKQRTLPAPDSRSESWRYYLDGRLKQRTLSSGNHWEFVYNDALLTAEATMRTGSTFGLGTVLDKRTVKTDVRGNVIERESFTDVSQSFLFEYEYDGANRLIGSTGPAGDALEHADSGEVVSARQTATRSYEYNALNNTFTMTETMGDVESSVVRDALGRPVTVSVETVGASAPTHTVNYSYDPKHHWVEITQGTVQARDLSLTTYTDVAGNAVLNRYKDGTFEINRFDVAGNQIASIDEIGLETKFSYDARNRLETTTMPDASQVTLGYDSENNLVSRLMPGNLLWTASYDNANRIDYEFLTGSDGTSVSRYIDYAYYSGTSAQGLLQNRHEKANQSATPLITNTYLYDSRLRLSRVESRDGDSGDGQDYPAVDTAFAYDFRSLLEEVTRGSPLSESDPVVSTRVSRKYDGYGQLIDERVAAGSGSVDAFTPEADVISHFVQHWDSFGRRDALREGNQAGVSSALFDFAYDVGRLDSVTAATPSGDLLVDYDYTDNGYRTNESISWNSTVLQSAAVDPVTGRDLRGRILNRSVKDSSNSPVLAEAMQYLDDGKVSSYGVVQGAGTGGAWGNFTENRDYQYDPENRRLSSESYYTDPTVGVSTEEDIDYTFDGDNLGVRIKAQIQSGNTPWQVDSPTTTGLDAFYRIAEESSDSGLRGVMIGGTTTGPAEYSLLVDGEPTGSFRPDPEYGSGNWSYPLQLTSGASHTVEARAKHLHPDSNHEVSSSSTFTINPQTDEVYTQYDSSGRTLSRSWAWDSGVYQVVQTFQWDASGQLKKITQTDSRAQPELPDLVWTAVYDGLGRRVRTTTDYSGNSLIGPVTVDCSYDPQVEFLEVAISVDGKKTWKVYGADLDANYGSFQGVGGLKVLIEDDTGEVTPLLHDSYGHVLGYMDSQNTVVTGDDAYVWNQLQMSGYGPYSGYQQPTVEADVAYRDALGWQGRRSDPTGFYGMGARLYNPRSGRFLSPDPWGHQASKDLYSYANGDPMNFIDPSGRGAVWGNPVNRTNPLGPIHPLTIAGSMGPPSVEQVLNSHGIQTGDIGLNTNLDAINALTPEQVSSLVLPVTGQFPYAPGGRGIFGGKLTPQQANGLNRNLLNFGLYNSSDKGQLLKAYTGGMTLLTEFQVDASTGLGLFSLGKAGARAVTFVPETLGAADNYVDDFTSVSTSFGRGRNSFEIVPYSGQPLPDSWPGNRGFLGNPSEFTLESGAVVDRYGSRFGTFVAPQGTPFPMRGLPSETLNKPFEAYRVRSPLKVQSGLTAPAFGQPGLGTQFELPLTVDELIQLKILEPIKQ